MIQLWSAVAVAVLTVVVGPLLRGDISGRLARRIREHAELREKLQDSGAALDELDELLSIELNALKTQETHRLTRKLNGGSVAALIIVAGGGGVVVYGLVTWAVSVTATVLPLAVILYVLAAAVGLLTIGLAAVGVGTLYEEPKTPEQRAEAKAARAAKRAARHKR